MASRAELARRRRKRAKARQRERKAERTGVTLSKDGKSATYTDQRGTFGLRVPGETQIPGGPIVTIHPEGLQTSSTAGQGQRLADPLPLEGKPAAGDGAGAPGDHRQTGRVATEPDRVRPAPGASIRCPRRSGNLRAIQMLALCAALGVVPERGPR